MSRGLVVTPTEIVEQVQQYSRQGHSKQAAVQLAVEDSLRTIGIK